MSRNFPISSWLSNLLAHNCSSFLYVFCIYVVSVISALHFWLDFIYLFKNQLLVLLIFPVASFNLCFAFSLIFNISFLLCWLSFAFVLLLLLYVVCLVVYLKFFLLFEKYLYYYKFSSLNCLLYLRQFVWFYCHFSLSWNTFWFLLWFYFVPTGVLVACCLFSMCLFFPLFFFSWLVSSFIPL